MTHDLKGVSPVADCQNQIYILADTFGIDVVRSGSDKIQTKTLVTDLTGIKPIAINCTVPGWPLFMTAGATIEIETSGFSAKSGILAAFVVIGNLACFTLISASGATGLIFFSRKVIGDLFKNTPLPAQGVRPTVTYLESLGIVCSCFVRPDITAKDQWIPKLSPEDVYNALYSNQQQ